MRKIVLLLIMNLVISGSLLAQSPVTIGPVLGAGINAISTAPSAQDHEWIGSFTTGVFARVNLERLYIQSEVYYKSMGETFESTTRLGEQDAQEFYMQSLGVPIMVGFQPLKGELANVRLFGGALFTKILNKDDNKYLQANPVADLEDSDWGYLLGVGFDLGPVMIDVNIEGDVEYLDKIFGKNMATANVKLGFKFF